MKGSESIIMTKQKNRIVALILALAMTFSITSIAFARASDQLDHYSITLSPRDGGKIYITCYVYGTDIMNEVGVEKIVIYEKYNDVWTPIDSIDGTSMKNRMAYNDRFEYDGVPGTEYWIRVTVFAENDDGYDNGVVSQTVTTK